METCKVFGREFKKITKSHIKTHGISVSAYDKIKETSIKEVEFMGELAEGVEPMDIPDVVEAPVKVRHVDQVFDGANRKYADRPLEDFLKRYSISEEDLTKIVLNYKTGKPIPVAQQIKHKLDIEKKEAEKLVGADSLTVTSIEKADVLVNQHGYKCTEVKGIKGVKTWFLTK